MSDQLPFGDITFAENPDPRCPCVLLLDTSGSMYQNDAIGELNAGLQQYKEELASDPLAAKRVEVAVVTFGGQVRTVTDFVTANGFEPPRLEADGPTPMGAAILHGIELLRSRKATYRANGILHYRPWLFLITDGEPTDDWTAAAAALREGDASKSFLFFAVGVAGANMGVLSQISPPGREPLRLKGLQFRDLFRWLSNSQRAVSRSQTSDAVSLGNPTAGPNGWATTA